jgi:hypothetical protein
MCPITLDDRVMRDVAEAKQEALNRCIYVPKRDHGAMDPWGITIQKFFTKAAKASASIEVHIDHPQKDFQRQFGVCHRADEDFMVMGPEGAPARVCIPYHAIRWFRRLDDQV